MKLCLVCNFQTASDEHGICPHDGSSMIKVGDDPLLGLVIEDRYRIESIIGQGSAGAVYRGRQEPIGRNVAIKVLHEYLVSDEELTKRFQQEAKAASRLSHPNIITIYDFGIIPMGHRPYIAMDLLDGQSLAGWISESGPMSLEVAIPIFKMVCQAFAEAHRQGVVHRDIKPENIVLVERGKIKLFPIVVDFGIARLLQEDPDAARLTRTGTVCGSPTYMSPEQCTSSKVDQRSDIYSLAVVLYETLTGKVPFCSDEIVKVMTMHLMENPPSLQAASPDIQFPALIEQVISKALSKKPEQRYSSMDEFATALEAVLAPSNKEIVKQMAAETTSELIQVHEANTHFASQFQEVVELPISNQSLPYSLNAIKKVKTDEVKAARRRSREDTSSLRQTVIKEMGFWRYFTRQIVPALLTLITLIAAVLFALNETKLFKIGPHRNKPDYVKHINKQSHRIMNKKIKHTKKLKQ